MELIDVVNKLVGPITPVADSAIDSIRIENLKSYCRVVDKMLFEIQRVATNEDSGFASAKLMGQYASKFLKEVKEQ